MPIKLGFFVAYDWYYLATSLPLVYPHVDKICLAIDINRISWTGQKYEFDEAGFEQLIKSIDKDNKIFLFEDNFYMSHLSPMENEVRQRNLLAEFMGKANSWHIQLDADEYFVDFEGFVKYLKSQHFSRPVNINCPFYVMFKEVEKGYLFIRNNSFSNIEFIPVATNYPNYEFGRRNGYFNIKTDFVILHQSWARKDDEILQKISNWGHKEDFDVLKYFERWQNLNRDNFSEFKNFHPLNAPLWESLEMVEAVDFNQLTKDFKIKPPFRISPLRLAKENSIWLSRASAAWRKLIK